MSYFSPVISRDIRLNKTLLNQSDKNFICLEQSTFPSIFWKHKQFLKKKIKKKECVDEHIYNMNS